MSNEGIYNEIKDAPNIYRSFSEFSKEEVEKALCPMKGSTDLIMIVGLKDFYTLKEYFETLKKDTTK